MKILAIGAHPDDIEIFMYGLLAVYKNLGNEVFTLIATDGSKGSEKQNQNLSEIRKKEANLGLKDLSKPIFLNIEDGELIVNDRNKKKLIEMIKKISPDLIVTHYFKDYHSDHSNLSLLVKNIASHYIPILYCDTMMGVKFDPLFYVDISKFFQHKVNAILRHKSQDPKNLVKLATIMNSYRAGQCNGSLDTFVEAYSFEKSFPFSDVRSLIPPPPKINLYNYKNKKGLL